MPGRMPAGPAEPLMSDSGHVLFGGGQSQKALTRHARAVSTTKVMHEPAATSSWASARPATGVSAAIGSSIVAASHRAAVKIASTLLVSFVMIFLHRKSLASDPQHQPCQATKSAGFRQIRTLVVQNILFAGGLLCPIADDWHGF
jgi:hypothetical protein